MFSTYKQTTTAVAAQEVYPSQPWTLALSIPTVTTPTAWFHYQNADYPVTDIYGGDPLEERTGQVTDPTFRVGPSGTDVAADAGKWTVTFLGGEGFQAANTTFMETTGSSQVSMFFVIDFGATAPVATKTACGKASSGSLGYSLRCETDGDLALRVNGTLATINEDHRGVHGVVIVIDEVGNTGTIYTRLGTASMTLPAASMDASTAAWTDGYVAGLGSSVFTHHISGCWEGHDLTAGEAASLLALVP